MSGRVLHVLDHSWPVLDGYAQRSRSIVGAQLAIGMQPTVLTSPLHERDDPCSQDTSFEDVRYFRTLSHTGLRGAAVRKRWPLLREWCVTSLLQHRIETLLRSEGFDVVHAHSPALCGLAAARAARRCGLPLVYEVRAFWEDAAVDQNKARVKSLRYKLSRALETRVASQAQAVAAIARPLLHDLESRGVARAKLFHVPNGVDVARFVPRPRDEALAAELGVNGAPVLGFLGTLFPWEGVSGLIPAIAQLHSSGVKFKMLIVGDGADGPQLQRSIADASAASYISYLGRVPNDQVERYYSLMDVLVYPRRSVRLTELVTPLKPLEAMALGKAILGSNVGGIQELVEQDATGLLFQTGNTEDFCRQAKRLLLDENLRRRLGERARQAVTAEKDWKTLAARYEPIYAFAKNALIARA